MEGDGAEDASEIPGLSTETAAAATRVIKKIITRFHYNILRDQARVTYIL